MIVRKTFFIGLIGIICIAVTAGIIRVNMKESAINGENQSMLNLGAPYLADNDEKSQSPPTAAYFRLEESVSRNSAIYAGSYIDYDTLVIQLTDISDAYSTLAGPGGRVRFEQVEFSLNQLTVFGEIFLNAIELPIVSSGVDILNNTFRIVLDCGDPDSVRLYESFNEILSILPIPIALELSEPDVDR